MGAPSRPVDDVALLGSVLNLAISAKSKLPQGSAAAADLDALAASVSELIKRASVHTPIELLPNVAADTVGGSETILVVEDNETILTLITTALSRLGYHVLSAGDGPTALERFGESPDDIRILVTDVMMPRMSGRELAVKLTALRPTMAVLYASGYTQDVTSRHGVFEPDVNFIQKPYTPHGLAARIRQLLDRQRA
jgi:two-component system cell cycle sensor histidine kinase/response regulator CckA